MIALKDRSTMGTGNVGNPANVLGGGPESSVAQA